VLKAPFLIETDGPLPDIHTRQASTFLVRSRLPRRIAPDYAAANCTPRPPRRLLLTEPAAPSPPPPRDAPRSSRELLYPPSASHRLPGLPLAGAAAAIEEAARRIRCCPFPTLVARDRPPSLLASESDPLSLACQSPPGSISSAEDARERAGGLVSTLTPPTCCP